MRLRLNIYDYMIIILFVVAIFGLYGARNYNLDGYLQQIIIIPAVATVLDYLIKYRRFKSKQFPKTALITGMLIAMIVEAGLPLQLFATIIAIFSKHLIANKNGNVFNPAALGIITAGFLGAGASWWGAITPIVLFGVFVVYKTKKLTLAAVFLLTHFALSMAMTGLSLIYLYDLYALFFAFFMLIEPRTSPHTRKSMIVFGASVAIIAFSFRFFNVPLRIIDPFLFALLLMNIFTPYMNKKIKPELSITNR